MANSAVKTVLDMNQKEAIGKAIGRIASGVYIVTVQKGDQRDGLMASWISQAAFDPPMLTVAIKKERNILNLMQVGHCFTVNILSKNNMDIFKSFVKPYTEGMDRFEGLEVTSDSNSGPVLNKSVAFMKCAARSVIEAGDHFVVVGEIYDGGMLNPDEPMVHLRSDGFKY